MTRVASGVVAVGMMVGASAAPVPKDQAGPAAYLATIRVGDKWVYETGPKGATQDVVMVVTRVDEKGGFRVVTFNTKDEWSASEGGLFQTGRFGFPFDPPRRLLKLPAKAGETWETKTTLRQGETGVPLKETAEVVGAEWVEVPAGRYRAVKVEYRGTRDGKAAPVVTSWYCPEVGLVRQVSGAHVEVLKSFTPSKSG